MHVRYHIHYISRCILYVVYYILIYHTASLIVIALIFKSSILTYSNNVAEVLRSVLCSMYPHKGVVMLLNEKEVPHMYLS